MKTKIEIIKELEEKRGSKIICYLNGDKQQFATQIGEDAVPILLRHLELIGETDNIDLFLYTRGGDMVVPIRIVKLLRSYCKKKFSILVPYRCHSAGTLICLGADEIVMTKIAELTPVDPTSQNHAFNPTGSNPLAPGQQMQLPVSVEDVRSYLEFAKKELGATDAQRVELYAKMATQLHPLALGNVYRVQKMIKKIAGILLAMHFKNSGNGDKKVIDKIIKEVTEDISVHNYPIYFDEAKELGLQVKHDKDNEGLMWDLFGLYAEEMKLNSQFNPMAELGSNPAVIGNISAAFIESISACDNFNISYQITKMPPSIGLNIFKSEWAKVR